ncbi:hypothetical protein [Streptomyces sp. NPDC090135]|uniref:hypothetical protein n=1 Tax=Streptomyces sp. NPDC090135 TaxID=3365957 RepID=UPI003803C059
MRSRTVASAVLLASGLMGVGVGTAHADTDVSLGNNYASSGTAGQLYNGFSSGGSAVSGSTGYTGGIASAGTTFGVGTNDGSVGPLG